MKSLVLFWFGLSIGFFDIFLAIFFGLFLLIFVIFDFGGIYFGGVIFCDSLSFLMVYLSCLIFFFCVFASLMDKWMSNVFNSFLVFLSFIFFLLVSCFLVFSMFLFYIFFESVFMLMFFFLLCWGYSPERLQASFYMVFYTLVVSFPFFIFLILNESDYKLLNFLTFGTVSSYWWFFMLFVFFVKLPVYFVHLWLPKAHVEAPVTGSMVLAAVLLKLGGYGLFRFSFYLCDITGKHGVYFVSLGLGSGLVSCFLCMRQSDLKSFVAYSSICHMGFFLAGFYSNSFFASSGGVIMLVAHGFCSSCLFYLLYVLYERLHSRSLLFIKGLLYVFPSFVMSFFVFSILNMGVPPSLSFFAEISLLSGLLMENFCNFFFLFFVLFFGGVYGIFFYVICCHGIFSCEGFYNSFSVREYFNLYSHFVPLIFMPLFLNFFGF